jgi:hypothetical protein
MGCTDRFYSLQKQRIFSLLLYPDCPWNAPSALSNWYWGPFLLRQSNQGMMLITHLHLVPRFLALIHLTSSLHTATTILYCITINCYLTHILTVHSDNSITIKC